MSYATLQDMVDEFGQREMRVIGDPDGTGDVVPAHVDGALARASDQIDFAAGQRSTLPLTLVSPSTQTFLRQLCMDIARYRLTGSSGITATDEVRDRYKDADSKLQMIISGKILLSEQNGNGVAGGNGLQPESLTAGEASFDAEERVFTRSSLGDYMGRLR